MHFSSVTGIPSLCGMEVLYAVVHCQAEGLTVLTKEAGKVLWLLCRRQRPVYLLNYAVYKPPDSWKATHKSFLDNSISCGVRPSWHQLVHHRSCRGRRMPPCTMLMR